MGDEERIEAALVIAAERHEPDPVRAGCMCGFCAWSVEHVVRMAWRERDGDA